MAIAAMVVGIVSMCLWILAGLSVFSGPVALGLGIAANNRANRDPAVGGKGMALTGIILGSIGFLLGILYWVFIGTLITKAIADCKAHPYSSGCTSSPATAPGGRLALASFVSGLPLPGAAQLSLMLL